jgi:hypothetical protein
MGIRWKEAKDIADWAMRKQKEEKRNGTTNRVKHKKVLSFQ